MPKGPVAIASFLMLLGSPLAAGEIVWQEDLGQALALARDLNRPVLVDFYADWCAPCRKMERDFWPREDVTKLTTEKFVCVQLDFDRQRRLAARYRIKSIPAVLVLDPWGQEIASRFGFGNNVARYLDVMKAVPESFADVAGWQAAVEADGENVAALRSLGEAYFHMGLIAASNKLYERATRTRAAHQDRKLMSELHLAQAWGYLRDDDHLDALRTFQRAQRNPRLERRDVALFGLVVASTRLDDRSSAVRYLGKLESEFPGSPALDSARAQIAVTRH